MVKTVITLEFKTSIEDFESKKFQEVIDSIKTGELKREFEKNGDMKIKASVSYWTNYKQVKHKSNGKN